MTKNRVVPLHPPVIGANAGAPRRVTLIQIDERGLLRVRDGDGTIYECDWLETGQTIALALQDVLFATAPDETGRGVVLGRISPYRAPEVPAQYTLEARELVTLKCGEATLELRADGKALLKGEDVLIRARGLQRIKAGSVSIN